MVVEFSEVVVISNKSLYLHDHNILQYCKSISN